MSETTNLKTKKPQLTDTHNFVMPEVADVKLPRGLTVQTVADISATKNESAWMRKLRHQAYKIFQKKSLPTWGPDLSGIHFDDITYYLRASDRVHSWDDLPASVKETYDRIGVPEHEKKWLAGVSAQYESEVVYESVQKELTKQGVIFCDMDTAVQKYPNIVRKYFGTLVTVDDNTFAALNGAVWSGGSFVYVPPGVTVTMPLQAYFRINSEKFGQFERTLIIADEGASVHYMEGCTAPTYGSASLHAAVVEVFAMKNARIRYTTVQNWSSDIYNLVTKRARAEAGATVEWVDCNIGSGVTMKYPAVYLAGRGARGDVLSIAIANTGQHQDTGAKILHLAPDTTSRIINKSIARGGGISTYRGRVFVKDGATNARNFTQCDALMSDDISRSDTFPTMTIDDSTAEIEHEASATRLSDDKLLYLRTRGLTQAAARGLMVNGFIAPVAHEIPLEYAIELTRLINMEMED